MLFLADNIKITHQQYNDIGCCAWSIPVLASVSEKKPKHYAHEAKLLTERIEQDFFRVYLVSDKILGKKYKFKNFSSWLKREWRDSQFTSIFFRTVKSYI